MAQIIHDISTPNDGLGDELRTGFDHQNQMNTELYNTKVDKVTGKGLSTNDYTNAEKSKLAGIEAGAEVNVQSDWNQSDDTADDYIKNKPEQLLASVGFFDYNDLATQTTPLSLVANVSYKVTNDALGAFTNTANNPYGVTGVWNSTNNEFDFSQLSVGDTLDIRFDLLINTVGSNENVKLFLKLAAGSPSEYDLYFYDKTFKNAGDNEIKCYTGIYIGSEDYKNYPSELYIVGDNGGTVVVNGWYARVLRKSVNIVEFQDSPIYKQKNESQKFTQVLGGTNAVINLQTFGQQYYAIIGSVTTIAGFSKTLLTATPTAEVPYGGKDYYFENKTDHNVTLKNAFSGVDIPFNLGADLIVPTNGIVWFKYNPNTEKMDLFFKSWSDVKEVIEGYFNGTNFYTDAGFTNLITPESSKIYINIAVTPATQYRWSGSAYVQIGGGKSQQIRAFYPSWNFNTLNTWRSWDRNTSNMLVSDANQSLGTGVIPSSFAAINFILITNATKLKKAYWSLRDPGSIQNQTIEIYIQSFTFNNNVARGSEINNQVLIQESFNLPTTSRNGYKDNFTIATHTLDAITGIQIAYRQTTGTVTAAIQGVQLILEFE